MSPLTAALPSGMDTIASISLKTQLRRAERMKKLKYGALIVPLVILLLLALWVLLLPVALWQRYRLGKARRRAWP